MRTTPKVLRRRAIPTALLLVTAFAVSSCGASGGDAVSQTRAGAEDFPITVHNCAATVTLEQPPERVVLAQRNDVPLLAAVGALDTVVAKIGEFPTDLYSPSTTAKLQQIPTIGGDQSLTGTTSVSLEEIVAQQPDVVFGVLSGSGVSRAALQRVGISYIASPSQGECFIRKPSFESVYSQVRLYGKIFGRPGQAEASIAALRARVKATAEAPRHTEHDRTGVAIFEPQGGRHVTVYGRSSMVHAEMAAAGLRNLYGNVDRRRFDVSFEDLVAKNPDYIIVLTLGKFDRATDAVRSLAGASSLAAIRNDRLFALKFDQTDPPTPLSVQGLERVVHMVGTHERAAASRNGPS